MTIPNYKLKLALWPLLLAACIVGLAFHYYSQPVIYISPYPNGRNFSFSITDDPDETRMDKIKPVYETLDSLGFRTTIVCWIFKPQDLSGNPDAQEQIKSYTLENPKYIKFLKDLFKGNLDYCESFSKRDLEERLKKYEKMLRNCGGSGTGYSMN